MKTNSGSSGNFIPSFGQLSELHLKIVGELTRKDLPLAVFVTRAALLAFIPVMAVVGGSFWLGEISAETLLQIPNWKFSNAAYNQLMGYADVVLFTPIIETGLIVLFIKLFRKLRVAEGYLPVLCALCWGMIHLKYHGALLGLTATWPFYCFTTILLAREKPSLDLAWIEASSVHALTNLYGLLFGIVLNNALAFLVQ